MYRYIKNNYDIIVLILVVVAFVIYKYPLLFYPYYWDEAWSYKPAIEEMFIKGPSLLPNCISVENYKGHPLLFYFLSSSWLKVFGNSIFSSKVFALIISISVLIYSFIITKYLTKNKISSLFAVLLIVSQSIFIAQSTLVLPEMLLALFTLLSLFFYLKKEKVLFVIFSSFLLLTKETGAIFLFSIIIFDFLYSINNLKVDFFKTLFSKFYLFLPIIPVLTFFIIQKIILGWFFYPEHIGYIDFGEAFLMKLEGYIGYLLIYQSRNILTITAVVSVIYALIKKIKIELKPIILFLIFIISYLLFSSINFYATRYVLSLIPVYTILVIYILNKVISNKIFIFILNAVMLSIIVIYTFTHLKDSDHNRGYENNIIVQKNMIEYCESKKIYNSKITTHFLMKVNLTDSIMGYLSSSKRFENVSTYTIDDSTDYAIISSNEFDSEFEKNIEKNKGILVTEFRKKQSWCKLYKFE